MGATPTIPIPGMGNDPVGGQVNPQDLLRRIALGQTGLGGPQVQGTISPVPSIPQPSLRSPVPMSSAPGVAQGDFETKGAHQRASMQALQSTVASAVNQLNQHENKIIQQKTDAYTQAVMGMGQAKEKLAQDPNNVEAQQQLQRDQQFLQAFLDPTTPEGKKNIKLLEKAYPQAQPEEQTKETQAAQASTRKAQQQQRLQQMSQAFQSGNAFPRTMQPSPLTQVQGQMVKMGMVPKPATGGQELKAQTDALKTLTAEQEKQAALTEKQREFDTRMGNDPVTHEPQPLEKMAPAVRVKVEAERANEELKNAQTELDKVKAKSISDPNSPQNQIALRNANARLLMGQGSVLRGQVGLLNYKAGYFGKDAQGNPLPASQQMGGVTVPPKLAAQADKIFSARAQFKDIDAGTLILQNTIDAMQQKGEALNDARVVKVLTDSHYKEKDNLQAFNNWFTSEVGGTLSPTQRDYIVASKQERERLQGLRKFGGLGGISDTQTDRLIDTLPGATTADADMATRQLNGIRNLTDNLRTSIPDLNIPGYGGTGGAPPAGPLTNDEKKAVNW